MFRFLIYLIFAHALFAVSYGQDGVQSNQQRFGSEQPKKRYEEAKQVIDRVKQDQSIGRSVAQKYSSKGSSFSSTKNGQRAFEDHPMKANPWQATWFADSEIIKAGFEKIGMDHTLHPYANWHLIDLSPSVFSACGQSVKWLIETRRPDLMVIGCCDAKETKGLFETWEFWRAENQYEANNFGISEQQKQIPNRQVNSSLKDIRLNATMLALTARGGDARPAGLRSDPHLGQSHFEGSGALPFAGMDSNYEVHSVRTFHDDQRTFDYLQGDPYHFLKECMPPHRNFDHLPPLVKRKRFSIHESEKMPELWRLPELSNRRYEGASQPYLALHQNLYNISLKVGKDYYGQSLSPVSGFINHRASPKQNSLMNDTCSSYWLANKAGWGGFGEGEFPMDKATGNRIRPAHGNEDAWKRLCYHPAMGTLYPLIGSIQSDNNSIAPLAAIRRFMDWTSWPTLAGQPPDPDKKANYMDDYAGQVIYTDQVGVIKQKAGLPDKLQRLAPSPTDAFTMDKVNPRDPRFKGDLTTPDFKGSSRYAHWNRRVGCMCEAPLVWVRGTFPPIIYCAYELPACIPWEE